MFRLSTGLIIILCIALLITIYAYLLPADYNAIKAKEAALCERERIRLYSIRCLHYFIFLSTFLYPLLIEPVLIYDILFVFIMLSILSHWFVFHGCILANIEKKILDKTFLPERFHWKYLFLRDKHKKYMKTCLHEPYMFVLFPNEKFYFIYDILFFIGFIPGFYVVHRIWTKRGELFTEDSVEA
jgi:hypothetical protein